MLSNKQVANTLIRYVPLLNRITFIYRSQLYDEYYKPISTINFNEFIKHWCTEMLQHLQYTTDTFDCDDYAFLFKSLIVKFTKANCSLFCGGYVTVDGEKYLHAFNVVFVNGQPVFVEPQTGEILIEVITRTQIRLASSEGFIYDLLWVIG